MLLCSIIRLTYLDLKLQILPLTVDGFVQDGVDYTVIKGTTAANGRECGPGQEVEILKIICCSQDKVWDVSEPS